MKVQWIFQVQGTVEEQLDCMQYFVGGENICWQSITSKNLESTIASEKPSKHTSEWIFHAPCRLQSHMLCKIESKQCEREPLILIAHERGTNTRSTTNTSGLLVLVVFCSEVRTFIEGLNVVCVVGRQYKKKENCISLRRDTEARRLTSSAVNKYQRKLSQSFHSVYGFAFNMADEDESCSRLWVQNWSFLTVTSRFSCLNSC